MLFRSLEPEAFGLDISDLSLKAVRLKKRGRFFKLSSWGELELPKGLIEEGEIKDAEEIAKNVKKLLSKLKGASLDTRNVAACLPENKAFLQVIKIPAVERKEIRNAVLFEAENHIPLPIEKSYLDFQVLPANKGALNFDVLIAAMPKETVTSYFLCLKKAGLNPLALEIESQSVSRAILKKEFSLDPVLIIDFGASVTSFIIFSGHSLKFTSTIQVSSEDLTAAISKAYKKSFSEAEKLKIKYGLKDKRILKAVFPAMNELAANVKRYISFYQTHKTKDDSAPEKNISKIILVGRGANLKGMADFIFSKTKIPAELCNPWVNIIPEPLNEVPGLSYEESIGYATALGLALRGVKKEF